MLGVSGAWTAWAGTAQAFGEILSGQVREGRLEKGAALQLIPGCGHELTATMRQQIRPPNSCVYQRLDLRTALANLGMCAVRDLWSREGTSEPWVPEFKS